MDVSSLSASVAAVPRSGGRLLGVEAIEAAARERDAVNGRGGGVAGSGPAPAAPGTTVLGQAGARNDPNELTPEEQEIVRELQRRDREVRQHERAHAAAGGSLAGLPTYEYVQGPDGKRYAVSGEVKIDTSPANSPEATIAKMEQVIRAALAPAQPSAQDRAVANEARQNKVEAQQDLNEERAQEQREASERREEAANGVSAIGVAAAAYARAGEPAGGVQNTISLQI